MADGVAVGAQGARRCVDFLDTAVPEVPALVGDVVVQELVDPHLHPERVALGRQSASLQGVEDAVGVRLEERELVVDAL